MAVNYKIKRHLFQSYHIRDQAKAEYQSSKEAFDEVDKGTKQKLGKRASRFQTVVHRAREKLKRDSSRSSSSSEDSEDISTSEEDIDDQKSNEHIPSRSGENSNRG